MNHSYEDLIDRAQAGDRHAFDRIRNDLFPTIIKHVRYILGNGANLDDIEDIAQETFIRAWNRISDYRRSCKLTTWLYAIAKNVSLDHLRYSKRRRSDLSLDTTFEGSEDPRMQIAAPEGMSAVDRIHLKQCIAEMSECYRHILLLCDYIGLTYSEAADVLGIPEGTVKSRLHRSRKALIDLLEGKRQWQTRNGNRRNEPL